MRKFRNGMDELNIWSVSMDEHVAAIKIYEKQGWKLVNKEPHFQHGADAPFQSVVHRKLKDAGEDELC